MMRHTRKFTIGRSRDRDIVLPDKSVSRRHAELTITRTGKLFLTDCQSTWGTLRIREHNTELVRQDFIALTDVLQFGCVKMSTKELLEAIRLKFPSFDINGVSNLGSELPPRQQWVQGTNLVRCHYCGAVKKEGVLCKECNQ